MAESIIIGYREFKLNQNNDYILFKKNQNNIVTVQGKIPVNTTAGAYKDLSSKLPEEFRPFTTVWITVLYGTAANYPGLLKISSDGTLSTYCQTSLTSQAIWVSGSYIIT